MKPFVVRVWCIRVVCIVRFLKITDIHEQRIIDIKFCVELGKSFTEAHKIMRNAIMLIGVY